MLNTTAAHMMPPLLLPGTKPQKRLTHTRTRRKLRRCLRFQT
nr:MAG TPA: hypothetical protein [Caudoviricetes sp.]